jgi:hypothetical protein
MKDNSNLRHLLKSLLRELEKDDVPDFDKRFKGARIVYRDNNLRLEYKGKYANTQIYERTKENIYSKISGLKSTLKWHISKNES